MTHLYREIFEQPAALRRLLSLGRAPSLVAAKMVRDFQPQWVLIAARGSSDNAARYAQYLFGAHNHLSVGLALPSLTSLYHASPHLGQALVIAISQSGQSPDIISVVEEARRQGALTIALTNDIASPLAHICSLSLPLHAERELSVAATKTYTNELLALALLSAAIEGSSERLSLLDRVPEYVEVVLTTAAASVELAALRYVDTRSIVVLGRGFNYCTAHELALKLQELCGIVTQAYSPPELLHGPVAIVNREVLAILVATQGPTHVQLPALFDLLQKRCTRILALSDDPGILSRSDLGLRLPPDVPEWLTPIAAIVLGQLFTHALCLALGKDPDAPPGLVKVTRTT